MMHNGHLTFPCIIIILSLLFITVQQSKDSNYCTGVIIKVTYVIAKPIKGKGINYISRELVRLLMAFFWLFACSFHSNWTQAEKFLAYL